MLRGERAQILRPACESVGGEKSGVSLGPASQRAVREALHEGLERLDGAGGSGGVERLPLDERSKLREERAVGIALTEGLVANERRPALDLVELDPLLGARDVLRIRMLPDELVIRLRRVGLESRLPGVARASEGRQPANEQERAEQARNGRSEKAFDGSPLRSR
jgi:hypothetical protein